jgi:putative transcriptional regulator
LYDSVGAAIMLALKDHLPSDLVSVAYDLAYTACTLLGVNGAFYLYYGQKHEGEIKVKNIIKVFRAMHDLTQEALAVKLGVTRQTVVSLEIGKYDPSIGLASKIARLFNVQIEDVFVYEVPTGEFRGLLPQTKK